MLIKIHKNVLINICVIVINFIKKKKKMYTHFQKRLLNVTNKNSTSLLHKAIPKKGYKMQQLHFYSGSGFATPSGIKVAIFGATSNMGYRIAANLAQTGVPMVFNHRGPLDFLTPAGDDPIFRRSNPYYTSPPYILGFDTHNFVSNSIIYILSF
jgi:hypothetical protein